MAYLLLNYPEQVRHELSNARLTKMIYLADWHSCINGRGQITDIDWYFDNYGPFVKDVEDTARQNPDVFVIEEGRNIYGSAKKMFAVKAGVEPRVSHIERQSLDHIIEVTQRLNWNDFIKLVYSTYPVASSERYEFLDLVAKARVYLSLRQAADVG